jgi:DHA1 family multidrug resistance protein-like MFS transporter
MAITAPFWGVIADRYGRKPMVLRSMFAAACTVGLMGVATAPWHLLALRFVEGAFAGTVTASTALVASSSPKDRLGYSLGLVQTAVFSGASLGPLFGGGLADLIGYRATFAVSSAMLAGGGLIVLFLVEERFTRQPRQARGAGGLRASTAWLLAPLMATMIVTMFVIRFASSSVQPIIPLYVQELAHQSAGSASTLAGLALGILGVTSAVAAIYFGRLGDKIGHRKILIWCAAGAGAIYLPMAIVNAPWQLIVLQALFGVAAGGLMPSANAIVGAATEPERRGVLYGMTAAASSLGGFFGPLIGAATAAALSFSFTFASVGILLLAMTAWVARVFERVGDG